MTDSMYIVIILIGIGSLLGNISLLISKAEIKKMKKKIETINDEIEKLKGDK